MWNSFETDAELGLTSASIRYRSGLGDDVHAYVGRPAAPGRRPGIVVAHHAPGWDEFYLELCDRLTRHGYLTIMPDLFCRFGHGQPDDVAARARAEGGPADDAVVEDLAGARDWLLGQPDCSGRTAVIGSCSGGRHALLAASLKPGFDAVVDLWGGRVVMADDELTPARPVAPIDFTERLQAPLLGIFGNDDAAPSPEQVDLHEEELRRLGKTYEFHRYDGAGHGFFYYHTARYRQEQAMDAWEKVFAFLAAHLTEE